MEEPQMMDEPRRLDRFLGLTATAEAGDVGASGIGPPTMTKGEYDEYMKYLRGLVRPAFASVSEMLTYCTPTKEEKGYMMRLLPLGYWQLTATCNWWEIYLEMHRKRRILLRNALETWDDMPDDIREQVPLTIREAVADLRDVDRRVRWLKVKIQEAKDNGHFYSVKGLLDFFSLPPDERQAQGFEHHLPSFLREFVQLAYSTMPEGIGWAHAQAVGSLSMMDLWQKSNFQEYKDRQKRRPPGLPRTNGNAP